jgi:hypothetical protein
VIFGRNDLVKDAPISRVDLLVCRNTLMYMNAETQRSVLGRIEIRLFLLQGLHQPRGFAKQSASAARRHAVGSDRRLGARYRHSPAARQGRQAPVGTCHD